MNEVSILQLQVAVLEQKLEEATHEIETLYGALEQTIEIVNNNIESLNIMARMLAEQRTARIEWS